jgi:hypothetical protein
MKTAEQSVMDNPTANARTSSATPSAVSPTVTLVTEAYNLAEGQSEASFLRAVGEVDAIASRNENVEIVVMDPTTDNIAAPILARHFPKMKALHLAGQTYDGQKNTVCRMSMSKFVVFLDGDCKPQHEDWLSRILEPFADPKIPAVSGMTFYEDFSITGKAMTILDFGFLFAPANSPLGCYVSNNIAFRREAMLTLPIPDEGFMRCHCYKHAQLMSRAGQAIRFQPKALVHHELPDVNKERHRRGYDYVSTLWADPELNETAWLEASDTFVNRVLQQNAELAVGRLKKAPPELKITAAEVEPIEKEIRRLVLLDGPGVWEGLKHGEANGLNRMAREIHSYKKSAAKQAKEKRSRWF